jgi:hypothetical protein
MKLFAHVVQLVYTLSEVHKDTLTPILQQSNLFSQQLKLSEEETRILQENKPNTA